MVIYWREENLLFSFPTTVTDAAVQSPSLVVNRIWMLDETSFRLPFDPEAQTSTYLESWPMALKWMREAVVDGKMLVLEQHQNIAHNPVEP